MLKRNPLKRREPLTDTMLLVTITIGIFFAMYFSAMAIWGGGFLRWQRVFDMLNDNAALIIVACGLTIVMIGGGIDISAGGVGNVIGTFFGVLTLSTINAIVTSSGLRDPWWQEITVGAMLCFFILLQSVVLSLRGKGDLKQMMPKWLTSHWKN